MCSEIILLCVDERFHFDDLASNHYLILMASAAAVEAFIPAAAAASSLFCVETILN